MTSPLVANIHRGLCAPSTVPEKSVLTVKGEYLYYHYGCDGQDDRGWGCGYRTLQTLCSWVRRQKMSTQSDPIMVPSLPQIQEALAKMGDKPQSHIGSREWIGSVEAALCMDYFYDVPCKIIHIPSGEKLQDYMGQLKEHFQTKGAPVMMGGDTDSASKGILGVCTDGSATYLLILDPHYFGLAPSHQTLIDNGFLLWRSLESFMVDSFYNLCLPQLTAEGQNL